MIEWKECKLGNACAYVITGGTPLTKKTEYHFNGKIPWLKTKEVNFCRINDTENCISELGLANSSAKLVPANSVIVAMYGQGDTAGRVAINKIPLTTNQACCNLVIDDESADYQFIYYLLKNSYFELVQRKTGSAQPNLNTKLIKDLDILLPPLPEQRAISSVLSSLDDKIDLLHRQNKTIESMAETLFRQWFVEEANEGWEEVDLEYITQRVTDGAHKSPPTVEVGLPMASVKDMHQWGIHHDSCRKISESDFEELVRNDCRPLKNDVIIAKDGSYLKHVFVAPNDLDLVILSSIAILRPNGKYNPLLLSIYLKMNSTREALENIVTGAVIPRIVLKDFRKFKLTLLPMKLQIKALKTLEPIHMKCWENVNQIRTLEKLRDTLLPKLMSGEVRVVL